MSRLRICSICSEANGPVFHEYLIGLSFSSSAKPDVSVCDEDSGFPEGQRAGLLIGARTLLGPSDESDLSRARICQPLA